MPTERIVLVFLRHDGDVYACLLPETDPVAPGCWSVMTSPIDGDEDVTAAARRLVKDEIGCSEDDLEHVRTGEPLKDHTAASSDRTFVPVLFDLETRHWTETASCADGSWLPPTEFRRLETTPRLWDAYESIAPSVRSIAADDEHGAALLSVRALEVLRDRAGVVATEQNRDDDGIDELTALAARLCVTRPSMAVVRNRLARALAGHEDPAAIEQAAIDGIQRAVAADAEAAFRATGLVDDTTVLTLSWSGTVREVLATGTAASAVVAESRPGCEGIDLAERIAGDLPVTVCTDAAIGHVLETEAVDLVLVGADTILPDGRVVNKTGTHTAAIAAQYHDCAVYVVTASDKVTTRESVNLERGDTAAIYDGDAAIDVTNPLFDVTPAELIDGIVTERGIHEPAEIESIAAELAEMEDAAGL
jgi:translation initiation factor 2B subunit (eIF-2B alpha/beta/delta family)